MIPAGPSWQERRPFRRLRVRYQPIYPDYRIIRFVKRWPIATAIVLYCAWLVAWALYGVDVLSDHSADMSLLH